MNENKKSKEENAKMRLKTLYFYEYMIGKEVKVYLNNGQKKNFKKKKFFKQNFSIFFTFFSQFALGNFQSIDGKQQEIILKDCFLEDKSFNHAKISTKQICKISIVED
jgi:hypothetical protein